MQYRKSILSLALVLAMFGASQASEVEIGKRRIEVPFPAGFVELSPKMSPYYETMRAYVSTENTRFMTLIEEADADALLRGEEIALTRYVNVETARNLSSVSVSSADFADFRAILRDQVQDMYASVEDKVESMLEQGNRSLSAEFSVDVAVDVGGIVPLPVHLDTDNRIANSMFATVDATVAGESAGAETISATSLVLHVQDKVLFLYVYAAKDDLEWTRATAAAMSDSIIAANPLTDDARRAIERPGGFDWGAVLTKALVAALFAGLFGLVVSFVGKRREKQ